LRNGRLGCSNADITSKHLVVIAELNISVAEILTHGILTTFLPDIDHG